MRLAIAFGVFMQMLRGTKCGLFPTLRYPVSPVNRAGYLTRSGKKPAKGAKISCGWQLHGMGYYVPAKNVCRIYQALWAGDVLGV